MSKIAVNEITNEAGTGAPSFNEGINATSLNGGQFGGRRNLIINGAMQVAQRGTSFTGISGAGAYGADRWSFYNSDSTGALTISNSSNAPSNFSNSTRVEVTTANASIGSSSYGHFYYAHEGQDLQQLGFGTSGAKQFTVSFWCRTNVPATYQWNIFNTDSGVLEGHTFTVDSSDTWEYKTLTFSADTTNGVNNDTGDAFRHLVLLYAGSNFSSGSTPTTWASHAIADRGAGLSDKTAFIGTVGNYFEITGVQLEVGDTATEFEHRSYGEELALCQRYYNHHPPGAMNIHAFRYVSTISIAEVNFPTTMRAAPTVLVEGPGNETNTTASIMGFTTSYDDIDGNFINSYTADAEL